MWPNLPNALGRYLESLTRIGTYPARLALPGHRHTADLAPRIQALLEMCIRDSLRPQCPYHPGGIRGHLCPV